MGGRGAPHGQVISNGLAGDEERPHPGPGATVSSTVMLHSTTLALEAKWVVIPRVLEVELRRLVGGGGAIGGSNESTDNNNNIDEAVVVRRPAM